MEKTLSIGSYTAKLPLIQGGMGVGISLGNLAGAVAKAGGIGIISAAQIGYRQEGFEKHPVESNLKAMEEELQKAREIAPDGVIGFNIMVALDHYKEYVQKAVEIGADVIISGAGLPVDLPKFAKGGKTALVPIVSSARAAKTIIRYWKKKYQYKPDAVVIEGPFAGGHLGFSSEDIAYYNEHSYDDEVNNILDVVKQYEQEYESDIPVVLAGGIENAQKVEHAFSLGVDGVQVATRFITTYECDAAEAYKKAYLNVKPEDIRIVKSPVGMPGRAIYNTFMQEVEEKGRLLPDKCLRCLEHCDRATIPYCISSALIHAAKGELDKGLLFIGAHGTGRTELESVEDVIASLFPEV